MEPIESFETSAYINTLTPGTYPKEKKLQSKQGKSLKSRIPVMIAQCAGWAPEPVGMFWRRQNSRA